MRSGRSSFREHGRFRFRRFGIDVARLRLVELEIVTFSLHQLVVVAHFHDAATVHHHQPVGLAQGAQAVGDGDRGPSLDQVIQRFLDFLFSLSIDRRCGFVEDQDTRIDEQRARDRNALALTAG